MVSVRGIAIAGVGIILVVVVAYVIVPNVNLPNRMNFQWSVYGMREGRQVTGPLAFISQGVVIDAIGCAASWTAQGSDVDWSTLIIAGAFKIWLCDSRGTPKKDITPGRMDFVYNGAASQSKSIDFEISCDTLLVGQEYSGYDYGERQMYYWIIEIMLDVSGQVDQVRSDLPQLKDSFSDSVHYTIYWSEAEFQLTGGIG